MPTVNGPDCIRIRTSGVINYIVNVCLGLFPYILTVNIILHNMHNNPQVVFRIQKLLGRKIRCGPSLDEVQRETAESFMDAFVGIREASRIRLLLLGQGRR